MQARSEEAEQIVSPSLSSDFQDKFAEVREDFSEKMKVKEFESDDDEEFSFACLGADGSPIAADDVFQDGQIKPIFPLFDRSLLLPGDLAPSRMDFHRRPPVKKFFVETVDSAPRTVEKEEESESVEGDPAGPFCAWSRKAVEASAEVCKKSNSTGFSKLWKFGDLVNRSNSDGRDAYVFLNNGNPNPSSSKSEVSSEKKAVAIAVAKSAGEAKATSGGIQVKAKKVKKSETASLSEYMRNRREEDRRRSYLPYRPELVGFFTNVNGGLSRNVHPF